MLCHDILNTQETNYVVELNETILKTRLTHIFEATCDVHEAIEDLVCDFYSCNSCVYFLYKCIYTITLCIYFCRWRKKWWNLKDELINKTLC